MVLPVNVVPLPSRKETLFESASESRNRRAVSIDNGEQREAGVVPVVTSVPVSKVLLSFPCPGGCGRRRSRLDSPTRRSSRLPLFASAKITLTGWLTVGSAWLQVEGAIALCRSKDDTVGAESSDGDVSELVTIHIADRGDSAPSPGADISRCRSEEAALPSPSRRPPTAMFSEITDRLFVSVEVPAATFTGPPATAWLMGGGRHRRRGD